MHIVQLSEHSWRRTSLFWRWCIVFHHASRAVRVTADKNEKRKGRGASHQCTRIACQFSLGAIVVSINCYTWRNHTRFMYFLSRKFCCYSLCTSHIATVSSSFTCPLVSSGDKEDRTTNYIDRSSVMRWRSISCLASYRSAIFLDQPAVELKNFYLFDSRASPQKTIEAERWIGKSEETSERDRTTGGVPEK